MVEANNNTESAHQNLQENDDKIASIIESMKKLSIAINGRDTEVVCDSGSECPIISYDIAKELGLKIDKSLSNITNRVVSDIVEQVSDSETRDPTRNCELDSNPRYFLKKTKKKIFNNIASESPSTSESERDSESDIEISE
ncbi:hypothetical protein Glove_30g99 [Diversispora epigaea]|uniref:Uncharacterized protein n=1 Tax=Diversispora epigaea TaxID=1348612 RepID=A0A397JII2_9GLOM|nr:hypothetical protein Glove_30g99 [Diversispora epigaea]